MPKKPKQKQKLNMIRVSMYLTKDEKAKLDTLYEQKGLRAAEAMRRALDEYLDRELKK